MSSDLRKSTLKSFVSSGKKYAFYSLPELSTKLGAPLQKLPISIRIVLESVLRNADGLKVRDKDVETLAKWNAESPAQEEIPFTVARIVLQDFTGVPLLVDLAAMRSASQKLQKDPKIIEPLVPVDLVIDHSVQVDYAGSADAYALNIKKEFERNRERYEFLKWGQQAFDTFSVVPPGIGIVHQVNLEYLAKGVLTKTEGAETIVYPDTLVGTDSHTTMINGLGVVGWGVGGIEAEAGMLGQPLYFLTPEVIGVHLKGKLREGVTATDMTLTLTQLLRAAKVVGKFVEYFGEGAVALSLADRATVANMAPEYGATMGYFPVDDETIKYLRATGRSEEQVQLVKDYYVAQKLFGIPTNPSEVKYTKVLELDLATVEPSVAGPKRPQDRVTLPQLKNNFDNLFQKPVADGGFGKSVEDLQKSYSLDPAQAGAASVLHNKNIHNADVLIAAITSCTNTSNPTVMVGAGLVAKKAVEKGLQVSPVVKASLGPGSRVVSDYLEQSGLQKSLDDLGFNLVGYGCTTCIGNSGPLNPAIEKSLADNNIVAASVLSGNRNFEARVHPAIKANYLMSPPLVVAFAIAGRVNIDLTKEPLGKGSNGEDVYLKDIWPSNEEIKDVIAKTMKPEVFKRLYKNFAEQNPEWNEVQAPSGMLYDWKDSSTYIQNPPFFENFSMTAPGVPSIKNARALMLLGDSVTTDHISPAGSFKAETPAGKYLQNKGVQPKDFNSYGSRRGNDRVMTRGTFANVRIKNLMLGGKEGGFTKNFLENGKECYVFEAAEAYQKAGIPLVVLGGKEYGTGSSRDWAAKGTNLLGVKVVVVESFERIHRSNLVGMGVLPCCFEEGTSIASLGLKGDETFNFHGISNEMQPMQKIEMEVLSPNGSSFKVPVVARLDTPIEVEYYKHGGILPYVLRELLSK